jgi:rfaE bifunctional protein kinase chain/domain
VAALSNVDKVIIFNDIQIDTIIHALKPDVYVKGEEFAKIAKTEQSDVRLVESLGGKVIFNSGEIKHSDASLLEYDAPDIREQHFRIYKEALSRQRIDFGRLLDYCSEFQHLRILVIGDTIVDQYIACDALGMSSEAPVLVVRELECKVYSGAAAIVAKHIAALGAHCTFISVVGSDEPGRMVETDLKQDGIDTQIIVDDERPTVFKIRYMVGAQKILRVSRLKDHYINEELENRIVSKIRSEARHLDGIVVSDFSYGLITPKILETIIHVSQNNDVRLFGDSQSSSQIGNIGNFRGFDLLTPTEKETRLALEDKYNGLEVVGRNFLEVTNSRNVALTLSDKGFIVFVNNRDKELIRTQHFPALAVNPIDIVGAGDALLAGFAIAMCAGANAMEAAAITSGVAFLAVNKVGNIPVEYDELVNWINLYLERITH